MSGSSSSSWTCYLCPFATSRISQLKKHIDKAHINLTGDSKSTADSKVAESFIKRFVRKTPPKLSKAKYVQLEAETFNINTVPKQKVSPIKSSRKATVYNIVQSQTSQEDTPVTMNINEVYGSICQQECEILSMLTMSETIVLESDEEPSIIGDDEVEFLEFTNSVSSLKDVFTPLFDNSYKCEVCPFVTFSRRGLMNHKSRSHSLRNKSPAEDGKHQKKIVDYFNISPKVESSDKKPTMSNYTLLKTEPQVNTQLIELRNLYESMLVPSSAKRAKVDAKKASLRGVAKNLALLQMKGIQCQHCLFRSTTKALIDIHIEAQHKNKSTVNVCTSETTGIKILKVHNENNSPLGKTKESVLIKPSQIPRPKVDKEKLKLQKENFTNFQKETSPKRPKFEKVTKPTSPTINKNVCKECTETFTSLRSLQFHLKNVHKPSEGRRGPTRRYYRNIKNDSYLKYFCQQSLEGVIYQCSICPKKLSSTKALNKHTDMIHSSFYNSTSQNTDILHQLKVPIIISECSVPEEMTQNDFLFLFSLMKKSS